MEMRFPLILDGATGTQLQKRGYQGDVSAEQWVLDHPDSIQDIQRRYVQAGSRVVYAPTFGDRNRPVGEMSPATQARVSTACRDRATRRWLYSAVWLKMPRSSSFCRLAPKVGA